MVFFQSQFCQLHGQNTADYCWVMKTLSHLGSASETWLGLIRVLLGSLVNVFHCSVIREDMSRLWTFKATPATWKQRTGLSQQQQQASIQFSHYYNRLDMKQARASVSLSMELISWLLSVHMALFFSGWEPYKRERAVITGGLSSLAMLTTPLMAVMQLTRLLSVRARGDSRSVQQPQGRNKSPGCAAVEHVVRFLPDDRQ